LGDLSSSVGWNKGDLIQKLEAKRQERASAYYQKKKTLEKNIEQELNNVSEIQKLKKELRQYGY
jgi:hypothetical protein